MAYYISGQGGPQRYIDTSQAVWGRWPMAGWPNCGGTMSGLGGWGGGCGCGGGGCPRCGMSPCMCSMRGLGTTMNPEDVQGGTGFAAGGKDIPQPPPGTPPALPPNVKFTPPKTKEPDAALLTRDMFDGYVELMAQAALEIQKDETRANQIRAGGIELWARSGGKVSEFEKGLFKNLPGDLLTVEEMNLIARSPHISAEGKARLAAAREAACVLKAPSGLGSSAQLPNTALECSRLTRAAVMDAVYGVQPPEIAPAPPPGIKVDPSLAAPPTSPPGLPPTLFGYDSTTVLLGAGAALVAIYLLTKD